MLARNGFSWIVVIVLCAVVAADIDVEYFFGNSLRQARDLSCDDEVMTLYCDTKCGGDHACLFGKCFCIQEKGDDQKDLVQKPPPEENKFLDFDDYTEMTPLMSADTFPEHSALRHHIAHFCPNLEEARKCIRKCMQLGKPAFCGKDHVCYCGHKTEEPDGEDKMDVKALYSQFRDLYKKYFGNNDYHHEYDYTYDH